MLIVGGGISGLAAAYLLRGRGVDVTVLEGSPRLGGKLAVSEVAGIAVDYGAEALLARRPEGTDLISEVGLDGQLELPGTTAAGIWTRGATCGRCPGASSWACPPTWTSCRAPASCPPTGWPGPRRISGCRPSEPGRRRARWPAYVGGQVRPGARGPAGRPAARRRVRGAVRGPVVRGHAGRRWRRPHAGTARWPRRPRRCCRPRAGGADAPVGPAAPVFTTLAGGLGTLPPAVAAASGAAVRTQAPWSASWPAPPPGGG